MALTKEVTIDKIEVLEMGQIQVREITRVMEDGKQLSQTYHRSSLTPGQSLANQPANVVAICNTVWTDAVVAAYQAAQAQQGA